MDKKKNDIKLIVGIAIIAMLFFLFQRFTAGRGDNALLTVTLDGEVVLEGPLGDTAEETFAVAKTVDKAYVSVEDGSIVIRDGEFFNLLEPGTDAEGLSGIRCIEANCRDHVCMDTGITTSEETPIICLPHRLAVRVTRKE